MREAQPLYNKRKYKLNFPLCQGTNGSISNVYTLKIIQFFEQKITKKRKNGFSKEKKVYRTHQSFSFSYKIFILTTNSVTLAY